MASTSLDANVLLRLALADLPDQHRRATRLVSSLPDTYLISHAALSEFVYALQYHYQLQRGQIATMVRWVLALPVIVGNYTVVKAAIEQYERHSQLSYVDCYLAEEAAATGTVPLWTFDRKLARHHESARQVPEEPQ